MSTSTEPANTALRAIINSCEGPQSRVAAQANISRSVLHRFLTEPDATITLTTAESIAKAIGYKIVFKKVKR